MPPRAWNKCYYLPIPARYTFVQSPQFITTPSLTYTVSTSGPIISELQKDENVTFFFLNGLIEQPMSQEVRGLYEGPYYGYFRCDYSLTNDGPDSLEEARKSGELGTSITEAYQLLYETLEEEGPFDGVIGFSHGATLAVAFLLHHATVKPLDLPFALFRCAVLIASPPPSSEDVPELKTGPLAIPTVHIAGRADTLFQESLKLHSLCQQDISKLICHNGGHTIPRDRDFTVTAAQAIRDLISRSMMI
ncbi:hypothetical protein ACLMJK_005343 [Lecanora helva]